MPVIGINKHKFKLIMFGQLADNARVVRDVKPNHRGQFRKRFFDLKASLSRLIGRALWVQVDRIDPTHAVFWMLTPESGRDNRCG